MKVSHELDQSLQLSGRGLLESPPRALLARFVRRRAHARLASRTPVRPVRVGPLVVTIFFLTVML